MNLTTDLLRELILADADEYGVSVPSSLDDDLDGLLADIYAEYEFSLDMARWDFDKEQTLGHATSLVISRYLGF